MTSALAVYFGSAAIIAILFLIDIWERGDKVRAARVTLASPLWVPLSPILLAIFSSYLMVVGTRKLIRMAFPPPPQDLRKGPYR